MMGGVETGWTLGELAERVARALAASDVRAPNGRVTEVPDARVIRWYSTIGLVDRPSGARGRTALYGMRHLLQIVAIKRRQAQGRSLAKIQEELVGATNTTLRSVAELPAQMPVTLPAEIRAADAEPSAGRPPRFWTQPVAAAATASRDTSSGTANDTPSDGRGDSVGVLHGVALDAGAVLLLPGRPSEGDLHAIRVAARPLLDLLAARGLLNMPDRDGAPA
jgi:MerR HTH family regulatory protein